MRESQLHTSQRRLCPRDTPAVPAVFSKARRSKAITLPEARRAKKIRSALEWKANRQSALEYAGSVFYF
ncbi:hypothetical protein SKAU_G00089200 [Synaphobranchus kaupii]|uniref:Uncharacterized protein n=1 Tax=Synaphobranchus kaupii TaxID=118154 RepID=A0A9Q1FWH7_SYNKA|nr:hypothetical protein SKAU_G00089200 [Synaphobranchus kaupii]